MIKFLAQNSTDAKEKEVMNILWTAQSRNAKTGNIPTAWVGETREEAWGSCEGCTLRGTGCYAWSGSVRMGHTNLLRSAASGQDRSLNHALENRHKSARNVRLTGIGDIGRCGKEMADQIVERIEAEGLGIVGYTHHWRENDVAEAWKGRLMASCETADDADAAVAAGWRATMIVGENTPRTFKTAAGNRVSVCPAQLREGDIDCNNCRLCDASRDLVPIIAFIVHGNKKKAILTDGHLAKLNVESD